MSFAGTAMTTTRRPGVEIYDTSLFFVAHVNGGLHERATGLCCSRSSRRGSTRPRPHAALHQLGHVGGIPLQAAVVPISESSTYCTCARRRWHVFSMLMIRVIASSDESEQQDMYTRNTAAGNDDLSITLFPQSDDGSRSMSRPTTCASLRHRTSTSSPLSV